MPIKIIKSYSLLLTFSIIFSVTTINSLAYTSTFTDIKGHWAESYINELAQNGILSGYAENKFKPESSITRAEAFVILANAFYKEKSENITKNYVFLDSKDIPNWADDSVKKLCSNKIITAPGSNTKLKPLEYITREDFAVYIAKILVLDKSTEQITLDFKDSKKINPNASVSIYNLLKSGIMSGYSDNTFNPKSKIKRAEIAKITAIAIGKYNQTDDTFTISNVKSIYSMLGNEGEQTYRSIIIDKKFKKNDFSLLLHEIIFEKNSLYASYIIKSTSTNLNETIINSLELAYTINDKYLVTYGVVKTEPISKTETLFTISYYPMVSTENTSISIKDIDLSDGAKIKFYITDYREENYAKSSLSSNSNEIQQTSEITARDILPINYNSNFDISMDTLSKFLSTFKIVDKDVDLKFINDNNLTINRIIQSPISTKLYCTDKDQNISITAPPEIIMTDSIGKTYKGEYDYDNYIDETQVKLIYRFIPVKNLGSVTFNASRYKLTSIGDLIIN